MTTWLSEGKLVSSDVCDPILHYARRRDGEPLRLLCLEGAGARRALGVGRPHLVDHSTSQTGVECCGDEAGVVAQAD